MTLLKGTRGEFARLTAGADANEIKATIPHQQIGRALERSGLTRNNDERRSASARSMQGEPGLSAWKLLKAVSAQRTRTKKLRG